MSGPATAVPAPRTVPPAYAGARMGPVDLFVEGNHRGDDWTPAQLRAMADNYERAKGVIDVPFVLGHEEDQLLTGVPASGWLDSVKVGEIPGPDGKPLAGLVGSFADVRPDVAALRNANAFRRLSVEVWDENDLPPEAVALGCKGPMIRRVAALGGTQPQIKWLRPMPLATYAERAVRRPPWRTRLSHGGKVRAADGRAWRVFFEVKAMAERSEVEGQLKQLGWTDDMVAALKGLPDEDLGTLGMATMSAAAGITPAVTGDAAPPDATVDPNAPPADPLAPTPPPDVPDRDTMIADLVTLGEDPAALQAMDPDALLAMWQEKKGTPMSEPNPSTPPAKPQASTPPTSPNVPSLPATMDPAVKQVVLKYAEVAVRQLLAANATGVQANVRLNQQLAAELARRKAAERESTVKAYCERWVKERKALPADVDPKSTVDNLWHQLMRASDTKVLKFGEGKDARQESEFAAMVRAVDNRPQNHVRIYGEKMPSGGNVATLEPDERRRMLSHTPHGRAILAKEDRRARAAK